MKSKSLTSTLKQIVGASVITAAATVSAQAATASTPAACTAKATTPAPCSGKTSCDPRKQKPVNAKKPTSTPAPSSGKTSCSPVATPAAAGKAGCAPK